MKYANYWWNMLFVTLKLSVTFNFIWVLVNVSSVIKHTISKADVN
jgi:hypothetical protein